MKPRPNGHSNGSDPRFDPFRRETWAAGVAPAPVVKQSLTTQSPPARTARVRQGRAYTRCRLHLAGLLVACLCVLPGCWPPFGVEVGSGEVHQDRFQSKRGSGVEWSRDATGRESFRSWRDDGTENSGVGGSVRGGLRPAQ